METKDTEIERRMNQSDKEYERRVREEYVQAAWKRWLDAVKKNKATAQQPPRQ